MPEGCCKNEKQVIKIKENFTSTQAVKITPTELTVFVVGFVPALKFSLTNNYTAILCADSKAPPGKPVSLSILYRSILI